MAADGGGGGGGGGGGVMGFGRAGLPPGGSPALFAGALLAAALAESAWRWRWRWCWGPGRRGDLARFGLGACLVVAGAAQGLGAVAEMRRGGTGVLHSKPSTALVTDGPFAHQRNPIYAALLHLSVALALAYDSGWALAAAALAALWLHAVVVPAEEAFMADLVGGGAFAEYCAAVPRWSPVPSLLLSYLDGGVPRPGVDVS